MGTLRTITEETIAQFNLRQITDETIAQVQAAAGVRVYDAMVEIQYRGRRLPAYLVAGIWEAVIDGYSYRPSEMARQPGETDEVVRTRLAAWAASRPELFAHWE